MINLDPAILDQEGLRKKRRKKLLLLAIAPEVVLILAGLFFIRPCVTDFVYYVNYQNGNAFAINVAQMQEFANILEPYIAHYDAGTALLRDSKYKDAETELRESLDKNPPKNMICQVRVNLSYSIESQADEARSNGLLEESLILYSKAEGVLYADDCASREEKTPEEKAIEKNSQSKEEQMQHKKSENAAERISNKRNETVNMINGNSSQSSNDNPGQSGKQKEIDEKTIEESHDELISGSDIRSYVRDALRGQYGGKDSNLRDRW